jgi:hypothetical protein
MNEKVDRSVLLLLLVIILIQCAGPIYYNKKTRVNTAEPTAYLLPSSYVGRLYYLKEMKNDDEKSVELDSVSFDEWESFSVDVHRIFRNLFRKRGMAVEVLREVHPGLKALIAGDGAKKYDSRYLSLRDVYKDDSYRDEASTNPGILVVFTKFRFTRAFPKLKVHTKYYVYGLPSGDLILVNDLETAYTMTAVAEGVISHIGEEGGTSKIVNRLYGLWHDEKDSYVAVCSLFAEGIIDQIAKQCFIK